MSKIRIVLADDHTLFRQGIRNLLSAEPDLEIAGEAASAAEAVALTSQAHPDLVLFDIGMNGLSSFEAARQIRRNHPETRIVFLTMYDDEDYLVEAMEVGASGYILKDSPAAQLAGAVRDVARGGNYVSPRMLSQLVDGFRNHIRNSAPRSRLASLTPREKEVIKFLAEGKSVKEIACDLNLSVKTIEAHKFNLMRKLDIHNKAQLVQYAIQKKIIQIPTAM